MDHCAWWKGLRRHLDEMRGCRVGTNYRIWLGKQCYKLNCHSSKKVANFFRSGQVTALKIILSGENIFKGCCNTDVMMVVQGVLGLIRISLVRNSLLWFFKTFHKYLPYANFGLFISLVQFFGQNIWLMRFFGYSFHYCHLPYANFGLFFSLLWIFG